jgi:alanine racemase
MKPTSLIEISESAIENNLRFLQNMLGDVPISSVVKGNAYGHGISKIVPLIYKNGITHFSVFSADEAFAVQQALSEPHTTMIMGMIAPDQIEWAVEEGVEFYVFDLERLKAAIDQAKKCRKKTRIHIELETGMNRTGFSAIELKKALQLIGDNKEFVDVVGFCSHLAGAESISNYKRVTDQFRRFSRAKKRLQEAGFETATFHTACSAAAVRYPKTRLDLARIGIMQYGFFPNQETWVHYSTKNKTAEDPLKRVISWKTIVMDTKSVKAGEFVGYGASYFTNSDTKIALIPVGYAHGFARSLSNSGRVLIRGKRFEVIGTVNMNMMTVDITGYPEIQAGDEVVIIGKQGDLEISVASFSEYSVQLNYELLTRLPAHIPRAIIK